MPCTVLLCQSLENLQPNQHTIYAPHEDYFHLWHCLAQSTFAFEHQQHLLTETAMIRQHFYYFYF